MLHKLKELGIDLDVEFENDFGSQCLGIGLFLKDGGMVGLATVILAVLSFPIGGSMGIPLAVAVVLLGANDCKAVRGNEKLLADPDKRLKLPPQKNASKPPTQKTDREATCEPEFVASPWGNSRQPRKSYYPEKVYASPEDKALETQKSSVAIAEFRAPNVQEMLQLPIKKRAEEMMRHLKLSGCNLRPYIYDKVIIATGTQRSGISTIIVLIGILEAALLGKQLRYITSDGDIYPVAFNGLANGAEFYGKATEEIEATRPGQASDVVWIFDEVTKQSTPVKEGLWEQLLTGFVKTGASARLITHGTTMKAIGFPAGMADQVKTEAVIVKALRKSDAVGREAAASLPNGGQHPSGEYRRQELVKDALTDVKGEMLQLPEWLLFDTNEQGNPCYVRTLLKYFPELDIRATGQSPAPLFPESVDQYAQTRQSLEAALGFDAPHPIPAEVIADDQELNANAAQFSQVVIAHLEAKDIKVVSLARLIADNYQAKQAFKGNSSDPGIREKGKETAKQLAIRCRSMKLLTVEIRGESSINLSRPASTLFGGA